ncbi:MAG: redoxin domain-containing protein [Pseudomonadota bacterium]
MNTAPELQVSGWLNSPPLTLAELRGKVVVVEAFQMLCPGCVSHGLPQADRIHELFPRDDVQVLGLHSVFEHHAAQTRVALEAFVLEYRLDFPIAIDEPDGTGIPKTMARYRLRGTPSLLLFDRGGVLRQQHFGAVPDLQLGAELMALIGEASPLVASPAAPDATADGRCTDGACAVV